jgi:hypothetical protein
MVASASAKPTASVRHAPCAVPIEVHSTESLLSSTPCDGEGILIFRGISYRVSISNWSSESETYQGTGTVCGLGMPADIAGRYRIEAKGGVWRNENGVEIHVRPPLPATPNSGELEIRLSDALLPRQPY